MKIRIVFYEKTLIEYIQQKSQFVEQNKEKMPSVEF